MKIFALSTRRSRGPRSAAGRRRALGGSPPCPPPAPGPRGRGRGGDRAAPRSPHTT